jgi:hypothetical protein
VPGLDERIRDELHRLVEPGDPAVLFERTIALRRRRRRVRGGARALLAVAVVVGTVAGGYGLVQVFRPSSSPISPPVVESPNPTASPSGAPGPNRVTQVLGPHCELTKGPGDFDGDGRRDTAFVYERRPRGGCPEMGIPNDDPHRLTVIFGSRKRLDRPLAGCQFGCSVFAVPDLNQDGTDELAITVQEGASTVTFEVFAYLEGRFDPIELRPPGTRMQAPGPIHFSWYGSVTHQDFFRCRTSPAGDHLVVQITAGTDGRRWSVTETTLAFDGSGFTLTSKRHLTARVLVHDDPFSAPNDMCGAPLLGG